MSATDFDRKCEILADLWLNYRDEEFWEDFIEFHDLGLPAAYMIANEIVESTSIAATFVEQAWEMMLRLLEVEDGEFFSLEEVVLDSGTFEYLDEDEEEEDWEDPESDYITLDQETEDRYNEGFNDGAQAEQQRIQEVILMHKRWAKEKNRGSEFMFWDSAGEVLTPINFEYSEEAYRKSLEDDGF